MKKSFIKEFQLVPSSIVISAIIFCMFFCPVLLASQDAIVTAEKAIIYSDMEMTSPIGFVRRGKKIKVGDVARNKGRVYPVIVSGKMAFIPKIDISTEKEGVGSPYLVAERFQRATKDSAKSRYGVFYYNYASKVSLGGSDNGRLQDQGSLNWQGVSIKGETVYKEVWGFLMGLNMMTAQEQDEQFTVVELAIGGSYLFFESGKLQTRLEVQGLVIPHSSYEIGSDFRVNSYGYGAGAGLSAAYRVGKQWGVEALAGLYYTDLGTYDAPDPYTPFSPTFIGTRLGLGLNYVF